MAEYGFRLYPERHIWARTIAFYLGYRAEQGKRQFASLELHDIAEGAQAPTAFELSEDAAQMLMDELWNVGLRPTQGRQSEGVTGAQGRHLEDMRTLAFAQLKVEKPNG